MYEWLTRPDLDAACEGPDLEWIRALHRGPDSLITLHRKAGETFEDLCAARFSDLAAVWREIGPRLDEDSFFSINGFFRTRPGESAFQPGLGMPLRRGWNLRWLNAVYSDVDCHAAGLDVHDALTWVRDAVRTEVIPEPSAVALSGRGLWLHWLLRENGGSPTRAWEENAVRYRAIQRALHRRLLPIGADGCALDAARVMRIPGSLNSKAGLRVQVRTNPNGDGPPSYSMEELRGRLGVERRPPGRAVARSRLPYDHPHRVRGRLGHEALIRKRLALMAALEKSRGGFREGCRRYAIWIWACQLAEEGRPLEEAIGALREVGARCRPPLPKGECDASTRDAYGKSTRKLRNDTLARMLRMTPSECEALGLQGAANASDGILMAIP
ncbi:MAG: hypothetical protein K8I02_10355, partial [Candidatus Methylomirabilis sp.]|nr:hypothetical protein [Deltaproteobacteria bacterium]